VEGGQDLPVDRVVSVRDSKTPAGPILTIDPAAFNTFVDWTSTTAE
jgi:hypothetical protein